MAQNAENKFNEFVDERQTDSVYDENDTKNLKEFQQIAVEKSKKWKLATDVHDKLITVESKPGKYGVIISRATVIVNSKDFATPEQLYSLLLNDWKMFHYLSGESKITKKDTINNVKRVVEAIVAPKSYVAGTRNYLYYDIFALCDEHGQIYMPHNLHNTRNYNKQRTLIAILKSVDKNNKQYYTKPQNKSEVRGVFYRTGYALTYMSATESKLVVTLEYDMKGYGIIRSYGNASTKCAELAFKMCQRLKKKLEFGASFAHNITEEYKKAQQQIFELKKLLVKFKDWKSWDIDELIIWITDLENNKFKEYESVLMKSFGDQKFKVCKLNTVNEHDLLSFGVTNFEHRKCLIQHIQTKCACQKDTEKKPNVSASNMILLSPAQNHADNSFDHDVNVEISTERSNSNDDENGEHEQFNNQNEEEEHEDEMNENNNEELELPKDWAMNHANDGKVYYYNKVTKETQWEKP